MNRHVFQRLPRTDRVAGLETRDIPIRSGAACGAKSRRRNAFQKLLWLLVLALAPSVVVGGIPLGTNCVVSFAAVDAGRKMLATRDEFVLALSPFDRAARMKTNREVSEKDFLEFVAGNVLAWQPDETNRISRLFQDIGRRLAPGNLPFPREIVLIKTSGREEGNASYTRQNAVVLPQKEIQSRGLENTLIHELFHLLSRSNPALRRELYGIIHFHPVNPIPVPAELEPRRITNPDGVQNCWSIIVTNNNQALTVVPVLYSSTPHYDPARGGEFFDYLVFQFLVIAKEGAAWRPQLLNGHPRLIEPGEAGGFFEQVGRNTQYIIHPDEILADNFVHLVNRHTNLASPWIVSEMDRVLAKSGEKAK
jgi:hypothetical protein